MRATRLESSPSGERTSAEQWRRRPLLGALPPLGGDSERPAPRASESGDSGRRTPWKTPYTGLRPPGTRNLQRGTPPPAWSRRREPRASGAAARTGMGGSDSPLSPASAGCSGTVTSRNASAVSELGRVFPQQQRDRDRGAGSEEIDEDDDEDDPSRRSMLPDIRGRPRRGAGPRRSRVRPPRAGGRTGASRWRGCLGGGR